MRLLPVEEITTKSFDTADVSESATDVPNRKKRNKFWRKFRPEIIISGPFATLVREEICTGVWNEETIQ